jgi:hypothetical protein
MGAHFTAANSNRVGGIPAGTVAVPLSFGLWVRPTSTTTKTILTFGGTVNTWFQLHINASNQYQFRANTTALVIGTAVANQWSYLCCRAISATERRAFMVDQRGLTVPTASFTSVAPSTSNLYLGMLLNGGAFSDYWDGDLAEFWWSRTNAFPAAFTEELAFQLAYRGPLSMPFIAQQIQDYKSLSKDPTGSVYEYGAQSGVAWGSGSYPELGDHPPLLSDYTRPRQPIRRVMA